MFGVHIVVVNQTSTSGLERWPGLEGRLARRLSYHVPYGLGWGIAELIWTPVGIFFCRTLPTNREEISQHLGK